MKKILIFCFACMSMGTLSSGSLVLAEESEAIKTAYTPAELTTIVEQTYELVKDEPVQTIAELRAAKASEHDEQRPALFQAEEQDDTVMYPIGKVAEEVLYASVQLTAETAQIPEVQLEAMPEMPQTRAGVTVVNGKLETWIGGYRYSTPMYMLGSDYVYCIQPFSGLASGNYVATGNWSVSTKRRLAAITTHGFPYGNFGYDNNGAYLRTFIALNTELGNYNQATTSKDGGVKWLLDKASTNSVAQYGKPVVSGSAKIGLDGKSGWLKVTNKPSTAKIQVTAPTGMSVTYGSDGVSFYFTKGTAAQGQTYTAQVKFVAHNGNFVTQYGGAGTTQNLVKPLAYKDPSANQALAVENPHYTAKVTIQHVHEANQNEVILTETKTVTIGTTITETVRPTLTHPDTGTEFVPTTPTQTCRVIVNSDTTCTLNYRKKATLLINHLDIDTREQLEPQTTISKKEGGAFDYQLKSFLGFRPEPPTQRYAGTIVLPSVQYRAHPWGGPWQAWKQDSPSGTTGQSRVLEAIQVQLKQLPGVSIEYRTYDSIQKKWNAWVRDGAQSGYSGAKLANMQLRLIGPNANQYTLAYRGHTSGIGWESWKTVTTSTAAVDMVAPQRLIEAYQIKVQYKTGDLQTLHHDFTYKAQSEVAVQHRDIVSGKILATEQLKVDRNQTVTVAAKPDGHYTAVVEGETVPYMRENQQVTSTQVTGTGKAITVVFDYRKEFTHTLIAVNAKDQSQLLAPKVTVKQRESQAYTYTSTDVTTPSEWIAAPKGQQYQGTATKNHTFVFTFKLPLVDPTISVEIEQPSQKALFSGNVEWKLMKPMQTTASDIQLQQEFDMTGKHYATRNIFGKISNQATKDVLVAKTGEPALTLSVNRLATTIKNQPIRYQAGYEFTNWYWRNYECSDQQDDYCFEWQETASTPDWSKAQRDELALTLLTAHQANETIQTQEIADLQLLIGEQQTVTESIPSAIKQSFEHISLETPKQTLATQTKIMMDRIRPEYQSDFGNAFYQTAGAKAVYVPDVMSELQETYLNTAADNQTLGKYVMPLTYSATEGFQLGHHALGTMTTFQINDQQDIYTAYEDYTGVTWQQAGDTLQDFERAYYLPIEAESRLKPQQEYVIQYQLGKMGLSDITLEQAQPFMFEHYMFGHVLDEPYYLIQMTTPFAKEVGDYRNHVSLTREQRQAIRQIDQKLDKGFIHTWARTNHGERSQALREIIGM